MQWNISAGRALPSQMCTRSLEASHESDSRKTFSHMAVNHSSQERKQGAKQNSLMKILRNTRNFLLDRFEFLLFFFFKSVLTVSINKWGKLTLFDL